MPSIFTPTSSETERKEPGIGGKPPVDRRPTGGGGGGGDDDWKNDHNGPRALLHRIRFSVFIFLAGDSVLFAVLVVAFYARQTSFHLDPRTLQPIGDWHPVQLPHILYLNTAFLLLSSLTMEWARHSIFREIDVLEEWLGLGQPALRRTLPWVGATLVFGTLFLIGQGIAWKQLMGQGFSFGRHATPASYFFYMITGLHAAHLVLGVVALIGCLAALSFLKRVEYRQVAVDSTAWYWHAMGLAWLILFAVLALGQ